MKKLIFCAKITFLFLVAVAALYVKNKDFLHQVFEAYHYDTFNVFHWQNIRFTGAETNKNFVKTKYIIPKNSTRLFSARREWGECHLTGSQKTWTEKNCGGTT